MFPHQVMMMSSGRLLKPTDLAPVKAWWTAGSRVVKDGANQVAAWRDQVGNFELTAEGAPFWAEDSVNGKPGIQLADTKYLWRNTLPTGTPVNGAEGWIFQLVKQGPTPPADTQQTTFVLGTGAILVDFKSDVGKKNFQMLAGGSAAVEAFETTPGAYDLEAFHYSQGSGPATFTGWKNDVAGGSFTTTIAPAPGQLLIGCEYPGHNHAVGVIGDFLITGPLTTLQRQQLAAALLWARGLQARLPGGHPFASSPPYF